MARILIVDDSEIVRDWLEETLCEHTTLCCETWAEAEKLNLGQPFDLVILDLTLADLEGPEAAAAALAGLALAGAAARVVLHSGIAVEALRDLAQRVGAAGWLAKPSSLATVRSTVAALVDQRRRRASCCSVRTPPTRA